MKNLAQELYDKIKAGQPVDTSAIPSAISTPDIPDEVFTIVRKANGEEFKRYLEADNWIDWLNSVADKTEDEQAPIEEKAIVGTNFYDQCKLSYREIVKHGEEMSGTVWLYKGAPYSISLQGEKIQLAKDALMRVAECAIVPVSNNIADREADLLHVRERQQDIIDYVNGRC